MRYDEGSLTHRRVDPQGVSEAVRRAAYAIARVLLEARLVLAAPCPRSQPARLSRFLVGLQS